MFVGATVSQVAGSHPPMTQFQASKVYNANNKGVSDISEQYTSPHQENVVSAAHVSDRTKSVAQLSEARVELNNESPTDSLAPKSVWSVSRTDIQRDNVTVPPVNLSQGESLFLGRELPGSAGNVTGITDRKISRQQVEVSADSETLRVKAVGKHPCRVSLSNDEALEKLVPGSSAVHLAHHDWFELDYSQLGKYHFVASLKSATSQVDNSNMLEQHSEEKMEGDENATSEDDIQLATSLVDDSTTENLNAALNETDDEASQDNEPASSATTNTPTQGVNGLKVDLSVIQDNGSAQDIEANDVSDRIMMDFSHPSSTCSPLFNPIQDGTCAESDSAFAQGAAAIASGSGFDQVSHAGEDEFDSQEHNETSLATVTSKEENHESSGNDSASLKDDAVTPDVEMDSKVHNSKREEHQSSATIQESTTTSGTESQHEVENSRDPNESSKAENSGNLRESHSSDNIDEEPHQGHGSPRRLWTQKQKLAHWHWPAVSDHHGDLVGDHYGQHDGGSHESNHHDDPLESLQPQQTMQLNLGGAVSVSDFDVPSFHGISHGHVATEADEMPVSHHAGTHESSKPVHDQVHVTGTPMPRVGTDFQATLPQLNPLPIEPVINIGHVAPRGSFHAWAQVLEGPKCRKLDLSEVESTALDALTNEQLCAFKQGMRDYAKDFYAISKYVPALKSFKSQQLVHYYYKHFKRSDGYREWKRWCVEQDKKHSNEDVVGAKSLIALPKHNKSLVAQKDGAVKMPSADEKSSVAKMPSVDEKSSAAKLPSADEKSSVAKLPSADEKSSATKLPSADEKRSATKLPTEQETFGTSTQNVKNDHPNLAGVQTNKMCTTDNSKIVQSNENPLPNEPPPPNCVIEAVTSTLGLNNVETQHSRHRNATQCTESVIEPNPGRTSGESNSRATSNIMNIEVAESRKRGNSFETTSPISSKKRKSDCCKQTEPKSSLADMQQKSESKLAVDHTAPPSQNSIVAVQLSKSKRKQFEHIDCDELNSKQRTRSQSSCSPESVPSKQTSALHKLVTIPISPASSPSMFPADSEAEGASYPCTAHVNATDSKTARGRWHSGGSLSSLDFSEAGKPMSSGDEGFSEEKKRKRQEWFGDQEQHHISPKKAQIDEHSASDQRYCLCQRLESECEPGQLWVFCAKGTSKCGQWVHPNCFGMDNGMTSRDWATVEKFVCPLCSADGYVRTGCEFLSSQVTHHSDMGSIERQVYKVGTQIRSLFTYNNKDIGWIPGVITEVDHERRDGEYKVVYDAGMPISQWTNFSDFDPKTMLASDWERCAALVIQDSELREKAKANINK